MEQSSEITPEQLKESEKQMLRLREEIDKAKTDGELVSAHAAFDLAERSHRQLCERQADQLRQIYMQSFYKRMRSN